MPLESLATAFLNSSEFLTGVVGQYYRNFLGRSGSSSEVASWVAAIQGGLAEERVVELFLESDEFNHQHASNDDFIRALYADVLGRLAAPAEVAGWTEALAAGLSRSQAVEAFNRSPEALNRSIHGLYAKVEYSFDDVGIAFWVKGLQVGTTLSQVAAQFFSSPRFIQGANGTVG